jgi:hypothetical protein
MTILDTPFDTQFSTRGSRVDAPWGARRVAPVAVGCAASQPRPARQVSPPIHHRGTGVLPTRASLRRKPITPLTTVLLSLLAAGITVWLGMVAQLGGVVGEPATASVPSRLAVVQVQTGETLQQVAQRVAPDAPVQTVVDQIRELNQLPSAALDAGQTLIAPVG